MVFMYPVMYMDGRILGTIMLINMHSKILGLWVKSLSSMFSKVVKHVFKLENFSFEKQISRT